jgi:hypothetical protein
MNTLWSRDEWKGAVHGWNSRGHGMHACWCLHRCHSTGGPISGGQCKTAGSKEHCSTWAEVTFCRAKNQRQGERAHRRMRLVRAP